MKKILTLSALFVLLLGASQSFAQAYKQGDNLLNVGIGLGTYYSGGLGLGASFEHGFTDAISAGGIIGYSGGNAGYAFAGDYRFRVLTFGVRGSYHLTEVLNINNDKLDLYAGAGLGYRNYSDNYTGSVRLYSGGVVFLAHLGTRYYVNNNVAVFGELGYTFATLQLGASFKF
jgi:hypothetical protein